MTLDPADKAPLTDLLDTLYADVFNVPSFLAKQRLLSACQDFCRRSHYWRELVATLDVNQASSYDLNLPVQCKYAKFAKVYQDGNPIADHLYSVAANGKSIVFDPSFTGEAIVVLALMPEGADAPIPQPLIDHYGEAVCHGAAAKLVALPNEPWTDLSKIAFYNEAFRHGVSTAMRDALEGYMPNRSVSHLNRRQTFF